MPCYSVPTAPVKVRDGVMQYKVGVISDLDKLSKDVDDEGNTCWKSLIVTGTLTYDDVNKEATVTMSDGEDPTCIKSSFSRGMRGMELSELIVFRRKLYSVDDRTGIVFDVSAGKAVPWVILSDGDGNSDKGFKGEWMTVKDGDLYVGGHGKEFIKEGKLIHKNYMWIKKIKENGAVEHINWMNNYEAMRTALGCPFPGYITHEAGVWSDTHKQWFFLPRKLSKDDYDPTTDETQCCNVLVRCSEDFGEITSQTIGELRPSRGFSSFKFVPNTGDKVIVATKSEEIGDSQKSFITVFTIDGQILLDDMLLGDVKYEGLEFI